MDKGFWDRSWGNIAPERVSAYAAGFDPAEDAVIAFLRERGAKTVCDAGCGCGVYSLKLARSGFAVSGFDIAEDAVALAKKLLVENGYPARDFRRASALSTEYPAGCFDAVVARDVIDHMPIRQGVEAVRELSRIVRPGGCVLLTLDETDSEYESEPHETNSDGDYIFDRGKWDGMVFHPYSASEIEKLADGGRYRILPSDESGFIVALDVGPFPRLSSPTHKGGPPMNPIQIAFLQLLPGRDINENAQIGARACREAAAHGADIILFPEMWSTGYTIPQEPEALGALAVPAEGDFVTGFSELAREIGAAIAVTFLERAEPRPRNSVCLFDRWGRPVYKYSKVHICDFGEYGDEGVLSPGEDFPVGVLDTAKGPVRVGSMICYDREFPESARLLALRGAELLLVPNACPMEINRLSQLRGRAYENQLAIATCNYPAPHPDCNGHSSLFDGVVYLPELSGSRDTCVFEAGEGEGICYASLDLDMLRAYRGRESGYFKNRRPGMYGPIAEK